VLWIKTFHIIFVASWFSGLFYLPRIFVNLAMLDNQDEQTRSRLVMMSDKLFKFMTLLSLPSLISRNRLLYGRYYGSGSEGQLVRMLDGCHVLLRFYW
jgi:putative membrane protein